MQCLYACARDSGQMRILGIQAQVHGSTKLFLSSVRTEFLRSFAFISEGFGLELTSR